MKHLHRRNHTPGPQPRTPRNAHPRNATTPRAPQPRNHLHVMHSHHHPHAQHSVQHHPEKHPEHLNPVRTQPRKRTHKTRLLHTHHTPPGTPRATSNQHSTPPRSTPVPHLNTFKHLTPNNKESPVPNGSNGHKEPTEHTTPPSTHGTTSPTTEQVSHAHHTLDQPREATPDITNLVTRPPVHTNTTTTQAPTDRHHPHTTPATAKPAPTQGSPHRTIAPPTHPYVPTAMTPAPITT